MASSAQLSFLVHSFESEPARLCTYKHQPSAYFCSVRFRANWGGVVRYPAIPDMYNNALLRDRGVERWATISWPLLVHPCFLLPALPTPSHVSPRRPLCLGRQGHLAWCRKRRSKQGLECFGGGGEEWALETGAVCQIGGIL